MPPKHTRPFGPARLIFCFAAAILVVLVVWVAVRSVGPAEASRQPTVVLPAMPRVTVASPSPSSAPSGPSALPSPASSAPVSPSPSRTSVSPSPSRSASPSPSATSARPTPSSAAPRVTPTTTKPVANDLAASVGVTASWSAGYVAFVRVANTGTAAHTWSVTVTHQGQDGLRLGSTWGATGSQQGSSMVFTGGPLAAGGSVTFGYQATKTGQGNARPAGCTVVGGTCAVR